MRELPDERAVPARASCSQVARRRREDGKAGIGMTTAKRTGNARVTLSAVLALAAVTALAGCSVERPGAAEDHSLDTIERNRAAMGVAPADTSYEQAERNRLTVGGQVDTSYDDVERLRAAQ